ncbi:MAG: cation-translocating P-type ATPase C-terminal domain-containing protein, partial [Dehalococcoidia bacterium]
IMALFAIGVYQWAKINTGSAVTAQTMAMVMFSIINIPLALNLRHPQDTIFRMETLSNRYLLLAYGALILALVLVTEIGLFQRIFDTSSLTLHQWSICIIAALLFLIVGETLKFIIRLIAKRSTSSNTS